ncbi:MULTISPECIES: Replication protein O [Paraburkholderia]|uniref:Replication protein O n=1 Tax=Paraburkholderia podalyriae TaxID=1938811 RepID=A0ABR7Q091_9BURK|nr:Replication protein O [Paraburkholderia podalyriae]MBC8751912.1 Replication protein O [Paraburkholderia podalyriae]
MSIAQRFVAGEGDAHPQISNSVETDSAALTAFQCDATNLPWVIFRAAFRASHIEGLPHRARALLSALARTVDAGRPFAAIFARRELLTGRAMQSMRTLYRSLDDLEAAGLIERRAQGRYVEAGLFGRSYLHLTQTATDLLGLTENRPAPAESRITEPETESLARPSATMADGAIYKDLSPASFQKRQSGQVPADLQRLQGLGFSDFLIFKLMRIARENGKRLSDVVEVTWDHLKQANRPINYLGALVRNPVDFGHQLRQKHADRQQAQAQSDRRQEAEAQTRHLAGQTFESLAGDVRYTIDPTGDQMSICALEEGVVRQAVNWKQRFVQALNAGRIRRCLSEAVTPNGGKAPLTELARGHIASLRSVLGMRPVAMRN